jgi:ABC-type glycerol-3-phosphate transport system substrate-binding protein
VVAAGLLLAGCGGGGDKTAATTTVQQTVTVGATTSTSDTTTNFSVTTHGKYEYPQPVINNYMQSCIGLSGGKLPPRINTLIRQAALACVDKL